MRVVTYHYVRPAVDRPPWGYYRLDLAAFRAQLDYLTSRFDVLDSARTLAVVRGERTPPDDGLVMTFDDGLVDHCEWVLPELRSRGLSAVFFVPTAPLDGRTLSVHRVHALLGRRPATAVHDALLAELADSEVTLFPGRSDDYGTKGGHAPPSESAAAVKRLVNYRLPADVAASVLAGVERRLDAPAPDASAYYLSATDLRALVDAGMLVGAHSVSHRVLADLAPAVQRAEIRDSFDRLDALFGGLDVRLFAYPFGGPETYTEVTRSILVDCGCDAAFTTVSGRLTGGAVTDRYALPRRDCNDFAHGDASFDASLLDT